MGKACTVVRRNRSSSTITPVCAGPNQIPRFTLTSFGERSTGCCASNTPTPAISRRLLASSNMPDMDNSKSGGTVYLGNALSRYTGPPDLLLVCCFVVEDDGAFYLLDQVGDGDAARAGVGTVEDSAAAPDAVAIGQDGETLFRALVATIENEAGRVHNRGRADPVGVAPDGRTRSRTGSAQDALRAFIVTLALFGALQAFRAGFAVVSDQI